MTVAEFVRQCFPDLQGILTSPASLLLNSTLRAERGLATLALKMLRLQRTADLERKRRFVQEAKAASACGSQKVISMAR